MKTARLCVSSSLTKLGGVAGLQAELKVGSTQKLRRGPLIKGTPQFLSRKQALVKVDSGRWSFGKCELSYSLMAVLPD